MHRGLWYRCCVDLSAAGNVIGASYELHDDEGIITKGTCIVGPFDSHGEALEAVHADLLDRHGLQAPLL